jgi:hypothetical protein
MKKVDFELKKDCKSFVITKFREEIIIDPEGKQIINYVPSQKKEFKIKNIKSIIIGPMQSRLWMYRKAINMVTKDKMEKTKFKSWQCLTIQLETQLHSIDLVIPDQKDMLNLIKLLVTRLKTVDGDKNSGVAIL